MQDIPTFLRTLADTIEKNKTDLVFPPLPKGKNTPRKKGLTLSIQQQKHIQSIIHKEFF